MESLLDKLSTGLLTVVLLGLPFIGLGSWLHRRRKAFRSRMKEPFTDMPLRPPGESLRLKIEELSEEFDSLTITALLLTLLPISFVSFELHYEDTLKAEHLLFWLLFIGVGMVLIGPKIARTQSQLWDHRLGFIGERLVGETLNQLIADGFKVFHDVPFEDFNIDHVIVGPPGLYVVETKSRRKDARGKGVANATVRFDGTALHFPSYRDTAAIAQAKLNASTVAKWLSSATGEPVTAKPILVLPGWNVVRNARGSVNVLNPKEIARSFPTRPQSELTAGQITRIAHQLGQRCSLEKSN